MNPALPRILGISGLIPFVTLLVALLMAPANSRDQAGAALITYGAVILSFLGGIGWGNAMRSNSDQVMLYVLSLAPFFASWIALLLPPRDGIWLLIAAFAVAFVNDSVGRRLGVTPEWFFNLRKILTAVVLTNLALATTAL